MTYTIKPARTVGDADRYSGEFTTCPEADADFFVISDATGWAAFTDSRAEAESAVADLERDDQTETPCQHKDTGRGACCYCGAIL
jgi:hypothetical protein